MHAFNSLHRLGHASCQILGVVQHGVHLKVVVSAAATSAVDRRDPDPLSLILAATLRATVLCWRHAAFRFFLCISLRGVFSSRKGASGRGTSGVTEVLHHEESADCLDFEGSLNALLQFQRPRSSFRIPFGDLVALPRAVWLLGVDGNENLL